VIKEVCFCCGREIVWGEDDKVNIVYLVCDDCWKRNENRGEKNEKIV